jgi:hypothetical protein
LVLVDQEYFLRSATVTSNGSGKYDIMNDLQTGVVRSVTSVSAAGTGYSNGASVTLSQGANATATGIVQATGGAITGITLTSGGFGYVDAPISTPGWSLSSSINPLGIPILVGPPVVVSGVAYFYTSDGGPATSRIFRLDLTTGAQSASASFGVGVQPKIVYHPVANLLFAADVNGDIHSIDLTTLAVTTTPNAANWASNGLVYDSVGGFMYAFDTVGLAIEEIDQTGTMTGNSLPLGYTALIYCSYANPNGKVVWQDTTTGDLNEAEVNPYTAPVTLATYTNSVASAVYASGSNKLYMSCFGGAPYAQVYDIATSTTNTLAATLSTVPGYVAGPCFISYEAASDTVVYTSWASGVTSNAVAFIDSATETVSGYVNTAAGAIITALLSGTTLFVPGNATFVGTPGELTYYLYQNSQVATTTPNYILLDVSGGNGGQVIAYIESDFYKCKGVWFSNGASTPDNGDWNPLRRFSWEQQNALNQANLYDGVSALPLYRIITEQNRDKMLISPDNISGAYKLWYYPAPMKLLQSTDRFDGRAGWDEWIVKDVAIQVLMAEESVEQAATLKAVRDEIWQRIQLHAEDREAAAPQKIMDVTLMSRRYGPRWAR